MTVSKVAVLSHPGRQDAATLTAEAESTLAAVGIEVHPARTPDAQASLVDASTDLVIAIGGDGTVLRAQRLAIPHEIPVLGVAAGRLGFLAETPPGRMQAALHQVLEGGYRVEERSLIEIQHYREDRLHGRGVALNDAVLARGRRPRSLAVTVHVDDALLANYVADGLITATATGSTAYSLAAGGPVLAPDLPDMVLTPIAAHLSFVRSIILPATARIDLTLSRPLEAVLTVDGQADVEFTFGDRLSITGSKLVARFARLGPQRHFYSQLVARLQHNLAQTQGKQP